MTLLMQGIKSDYAAIWRNGFQIYDQIAIQDCIPPDVMKLRSYTRFKQMVGFLEKELPWTSSAREKCRSPIIDLASETSISGDTQ
jgi:hypothetical protein